MFERLSSELREIKNSQKKTNQNIKIKTTPFYLNNSLQANGIEEDEKLKEVKIKNELLRKAITEGKNAQEKRKSVEMAQMKEKK